MTARLLVLGGGGFLGFHAVAEGLAAGRRVTVFSRSGRAPLPGVNVITGDRQGDLSGLRGHQWDAVLDTFSDQADGAPAVRATARLLSGSVGTYGYVSGMSVYAPSGPTVPDESAPVRRAGVEPDTDVPAGSISGQVRPASARRPRTSTAGAVSAGRHHGRTSLPPVPVLADAHRGGGGGPAAAVVVVPGDSIATCSLRRPRHRGLVDLDAGGRSWRNVQTRSDRAAARVCAPVLLACLEAGRRLGGRRRIRRGCRTRASCVACWSASRKRTGRSGSPEDQIRSGRSTRRPPWPPGCGSGRRWPPRARRSAGRGIPTSGSSSTASPPRRPTSCGAPRPGRCDYSGFAGPPGSGVKPEPDDFAAAAPGHDPYAHVEEM